MMYEMFLSSHLGVAEEKVREFVIEHNLSTSDYRRGCIWNSGLKYKKGEYIIFDDKELAVKFKLWDKQ